MTTRMIAKKHQLKKNSGKQATSKMETAPRKKEMGSRTFLNHGHRRRFTRPIIQLTTLLLKTTSVLESRAGWRTGTLKTTSVKTTWETPLRMVRLGKMKEAPWTVCREETTALFQNVDVSICVTLICDRSIFGRQRRQPCSVGRRFPRWLESA